MGEAKHTERVFANMKSSVIRKAEVLRSMPAGTVQVGATARSYWKHVSHSASDGWLHRIASGHLASQSTTSRLPFLRCTFNKTWRWGWGYRCQYLYRQQGTVSWIESDASNSQSVECGCFRRPAFSSQSPLSHFASTAKKALVEQDGEMEVTQKRVAVIGAGAAGMCAAKTLLSDGFHVTVFEATSGVGGTWAYSSKPTPWTSMYESLRCNIPSPIMAFREEPFPPGTLTFPGHESVLKYLQDYADRHKLRRYVRFEMRVEDVRKQGDAWCVRAGGEEDIFDFVIIAIGQYTSPKEWKPPGTEVFTVNGRTVSHSHYYKTPAGYRGRKILVVGAGPSGSDIALELSRSGASVWVAHSQWKTPLFNGSLREVAPVQRLTASGDAILEDGTVVSGLDDVVLCTGYSYRYPFLKPKVAGVTVAKDGRSVRGLTAHLYAREDPTLALMGLLWKVIPFPLFEDQAAFLSAMWGGRVAPNRLASFERAENEDWEAAIAGEPRFLHRLGPRQWEYRRRLASAAGTPMPEMSKIEVAQDASAARRRDLEAYRDREYIILGPGPGEWRVFEDGKDVTGRDEPTSQGQSPLILQT